jgi:ribosomal protein L40E
MALFDDIKKKVSDTTQSAVKATKELAETTRLNSQISDEQRKIGGLYSQLGKLYFEKYGIEAESPFGEICAAIVASSAQIEKLQMDIQFVKGVKRCQSCGADIPLASGFCGKCGSKVETPVTQPDVVAADIQHCVHCGAEIENEALFCGSCGKKQVAEQAE